MSGRRGHRWARAQLARRSARAMKPARDEGVVKLMVEVLKPYRGRLYDPLLASSSGMFVQSVEFGGIGRRLAHGIV